MISNPRNIKFAVNRNRRKFTFSRFVFYFIFLVFWGEIVYILFFSHFLAITSIDIKGNKYVNQSVILEQLSPVISGKTFNIIDKDNLLLARKSKIKESVLENFRQIKSVKVRKNFPSKLEIEISERTPTLVFCGGRCFLLDENAEAYEDRESFLSDTEKFDLPKMTDESGKEIKLGDVISNEKYIGQILYIKNNLAGAIGIPVENGFWTPTLISNDIRVKTQEGWDIYFNGNIEMEKEIEMLKAVLGNKIEKSQRPDLEYIDLRIDNKIFYKFRDGTPEENARLKTEEAVQKESEASDKKEKKKD